MASGKETVMDKVKRTFLRMASPAEFGGHEFHCDTVLSVNLPPVLARADAAGEHATSLLLKENLFLVSEKEREKVYKEAEKFLSQAVCDLETVTRALAAEKKSLDLSSLMTYAGFILDMTRMLISLVKRQNGPENSEKFIASLSSKSAVASFQEADEFFTGTEIKTYHMLSGLISAMAHDVEILKEQHKKILARRDLERYAKSYVEYVNHYRLSENGASADGQKTTTSETKEGLS